MSLFLNMLCDGKDAIQYTCVPSLMSMSSTISKFGRNMSEAICCCLQTCKSYLVTWWGWKHMLTTFHVHMCFHYLIMVTNSAYHCQRLLHKLVLLCFRCWWWNTLCIQTLFTYIAVTESCISIIMYCLGLFVVFTANNIVYKPIWPVSSGYGYLYILTKFHAFIFWVMGVESEEEEDEQNSLS